MADKKGKKRTKRDDELRIAGQLMSNACFNLAQDQRLDDRTRQSLREGYERWDAAIKAVPHAK